MKPTFLVMLLSVLFSCGTSSDSSKNDNSVEKNSSLLASAQTEAVSKDSANKMILSYLQSIDSTKMDLHALIFDATQLKDYLNDTTHGAIKHVKIMFAHTLEYINNDGRGKYAGYKSGALTVIIAGYDENNNYIYWKGNNVMDHAANCPTNCPPNGTAANDLFD